MQNAGKLKRAENESGKQKKPLSFYCPSKSEPPSVAVCCNMSWSFLR